jgi:transposase InsO family protein
MKGGAGCPMRIVTVVPWLGKLDGLKDADLSAEAKLRLKVSGCCRQSGRFSGTGLPNVSLTCRHFGINRSKFYYWKNRFDKSNLRSLENRPTVPLKKNRPKYSRELVREVRTIRKNDHTYSARKIYQILHRDMPYLDIPSRATIGRLISRENLFFRADIEKHRKRSKAAKDAHKRQRKPHDLQALAPRDVVEFDMKHIHLLGTKLYAFCALDNGSRESIIHIASSPSSRNAKRALREVVARFGCGIKIVNDNGSENKKDAEEFLAENNIVQYWARPYRPKDKPHIERFIGTFRREFLDGCYGPTTAAELQETANKRLDKYRYYRPQEALDCMTPAEFSDKTGISIPRIGKLS